MLDEFHQLSKRVSNWGRWGSDDELGTLNLITPEVVQRAAASVTSGKVFNLGLTFGPDGPQPGGFRFNPHHFVTALGQRMSDHAEGFSFSDDVVAMPLQCATQWDALAHVHYGDHIYNGFPASDVLTLQGAVKGGIDKPARRGIASRGVLLDIARLKGVERLDHYEITSDDLDAACDAQGVSMHSGDILLLRTGHITRFTRDRDRGAFSGAQPGLGWRTAEWLRDKGVACVCADNVAVEVMPGPDGAMWIPLHMLCLRDMGMMFGEMLDLEELAADCAHDGAWTCLLSAPPLGVHQGLGSPINPIALK